ncbi:hypothetical protein PHIM7_330 [Sinorhizobium phage phiM7]|uniref:Uncharacterized protein n=2 Tax=Emdodecavirus TaxID=1980937 RepID=S5M7K1_9CAUD|nr:hypothetical protein AB690_gp184 [Sinorhizobium phage phiM12]YP_009601455.1 hypothetical protein FDH46_gp148 [Sinorhizobium phage phiM7]AGR48056.2 hypothetical protein SmphiM12_424 [Sinorhizobium phage phiM12]AKF12875.1 hypothetical protein PHIM7_330 [Sinorhizobium phage phiM7]AKF13235.1 hypothetical protein PHIM19_330 [Sinorhizobium phage phiM19]
MAHKWFMTGTLYAPSHEDVGHYSLKYANGRPHMIRGDTITFLSRNPVQPGQFEFIIRSDDVIINGDDYG